MTSEQLTLLNHATEELQKTQELLQAQSEQGKPIAIDSATVAKRLGISSSTLSRAKKTGRLPYTHPYNGGIAVVYFSHTFKGTNYWRVWEKDA